MRGNYGVRSARSRPGLVALACAGLAATLGGCSKTSAAADTSRSGGDRRGRRADA
jgi:hypothetical protein